MNFKLVTDTINEGFGFIKTEFFDLFKKLLIVNAITIGIILLIMALPAIFLDQNFFQPENIGYTVGTLYVSLLYTEANPLAAFAIIILLGVIIFTINTVIGLINLSAYRIVHEQHGQKRAVSIIGLFREKAKPFIIYSLITSPIYAVFSVPLVLVWGGLGAFFALLIWLALNLLLQFGLYELAISGKGPVESILSSLLFVKNDFTATLLFSMIIALIGLVVQIAYVILSWVVMTILPFVYLGWEGLIILLAAVLIAFALLSLPHGIVLLSLLGILVFLSVGTAILQTLYMPLAYRYWNKLKEGAR